MYAYGSPNASAPSVEKMILSPLNGLGTCSASKIVSELLIPYQSNKQIH